MTTVMLVDDQEIIRAGLRTIIDAQYDLAVVAEAADGFAALTALETTVPDVLLMDLRMPGIDGIETVRRVRRTVPQATMRILVLTTFEQEENVLAAIRAGADGFLSKGAGPAELADAIRRAAAGDRAFSPGAAGALADHVAKDRAIAVDPVMADRLATLTPRELEVVQALVSGLDSGEIAETLFLSPYTVKTHTNRAMAKIGARDRGQLVSAAVRGGLLPS
jgi:DNA-binding NarL/FixJ family response regulator